MSKLDFNKQNVDNIKLKLYKKVLNVYRINY